MIRPALIGTVLWLGVASSLGGALSAQNTWIVDAANGPGTHFTTLQPALTAAVDGDLIQVRPGFYVGATVNKGVTIVGSAQTQFTGLRIENIGAGRQVVLCGFALPGSALSTFRVLNNQGRVVLDRLAVGVDTFEITNCAAVHCNDCYLGPGVTAGLGNVVSGSIVTFSRSRLVGSSGAGFGFPPSHPGLTVTNSGVGLTQCVVEGGLGGMTRNPEPALVATNSTLMVTGDVRAGILVSGPTTVPVPAVIATGGTLEFDPRVRLVALGGAPAITGNASVVSHLLPALTASGIAPGGTCHAELVAPPGDLAVFCLGPAAQPAVTAYGVLWLDPQSLSVLAVRVQPASGVSPLAVPVPPLAVLSFGAWTLQSLSGPFTGGFRFSGPATFCLH